MSLLRRTWLPVVVFVTVTATATRLLAIPTLAASTSIAAVVMTAVLWPALVRDHSRMIVLRGGVAGALVGVLAQLVPVIGVLSWPILTHAHGDESGGMLNAVALIVSAVAGVVAGLVCGVSGAVLGLLTFPPEADPA